MSDITFEAIENGNIEQCRELCNALMEFQKSQATISPESFDSMIFESRMKKSFENALRSDVVVLKDDGVPVGYVFSTIDEITEEIRNALPDWAPRVPNGIGFYPDWVKLPKKIGCLNNLYFRDEYRGMGLGSKLFDLAMEWLESFDDTDLSFVYISNGNSAAYDFYIQRGFTYSHEVFGGFIKAAYTHKGVTRLR